MESFSVLRQIIAHSIILDADARGFLIWVSFFVSWLHFLDFNSSAQYKYSRSKGTYLSLIILSGSSNQRRGSAKITYLKVLLNSLFVKRAHLLIK
jgi:hypothetical protein